MQGQVTFFKVVVFEITPLFINILLIKIVLVRWNEWGL